MIIFIYIYIDSTHTTSDTQMYRRRTKSYKKNINLEALRITYDMNPPHRFDFLQLLFVQQQEE